MSLAGSTKSSRPAARHAWARLSDEALLDLRFCDLRLRLDEPRLQAGIGRLYSELDQRGIRHRPQTWLAEEWFSPDGVPGIAIPFYLAHPRLRRLEYRLVHEIEGGSARDLIRILRHEAGHAIDTAFRLRRHKAWREVFGRASQRYPTYYAPRPASRDFVQHLGLWYAQSHPTEDFAETFAVWLPPRSRWRSAYAGWPALAKLEYVDAVLQELSGQRPRRASRAFIDPLSTNRRTLREHYRRKLAVDRSGEDERYDRRLLRVFGHADDHPDNRPASHFLRSLRGRLREEMNRQVVTHPYLVNHVLDTAIQRARILRLRLAGDVRRAERDATRMVRHIILDTLARNREKYRL